jgi:hypothetical protein
MLPVSLDCPFLIAPSFFSNVSTLSRLLLRLNYITTVQLIVGLVKKTQIHTLYNSFLIPLEIIIINTYLFCIISYKCNDMNEIGRAWG